MKRIVGLTTAIVLAASCSSNGSKVEVKTSSTITTTTSSSKPTVRATTTTRAVTTTTSAAGIGATLTFTNNDGDKVEVTLVKIVDPTGGGEYETPGKGNRYVAVQLRFENVGDAPADTAPFISMNVKDQDGQEYDPASIVDLAAGPSLPGTVKIAPGEVTLGYVGFELPVSARVAAVKYSLDMFDDAIGLWKV